MASATSSLGTTTYQVNALGQRIRKSNSLTDRIFTYDATGHLIAEHTAAGALLKEYVWLGDAPLAVIDSTGIYSIHVDHLNSPRAIYDASQQLRWKWEQQDAFGVNVPDENPSSLGTLEFNFRFPGQYVDTETGLHYAYFRDCYDPAAGRFCQPDLIGTVLFGDMAIRSLGRIGFEQPQLEDDLYTENPKYNHLYAYVDGDPVSYSDPLGLFPGNILPPGDRSTPNYCVAGGNGDKCSHCGKNIRSFVYRVCLAVCLATGWGHGGNPRNPDAEPSRHRQREKMDEAERERQRDQKPRPGSGGPKPPPRKK